MRGQAFIVFDEALSSTAALRSLQNFPFYDQNIKISFAKSTSNATLIKQGNYFPLLKTTQEDDPTSAQEEDDPSRKRARSGSVEEEEEDMDVEDDPSHPPSAKKQLHDAAETSGSVAVDALNIPASLTLLVRNLPKDVSEEMLVYLFQQYPGYKGIRMVPGKTELAFVDFATEAESTAAKLVLDGFNITPARQMIVEYARQ